MPKRAPPLPPIPSSFTTKKNQILASLAQPTETYTDASPKGSVDLPIRDLIDRINALEGFVTTSSCSGRVSVFAEGEKVKPPARNATASKDSGGSDDKSSTPGRVEDAGNLVTNSDETNQDGEKDYALKTNANSKQQNPTPGGKGCGGKWLFVSHDPLPLDFDIKNLGLHSPVGSSSDTDPSPPPSSLNITDPGNRYIRFAFEPMILHILTASLPHASLLLTSAINSGFRESGLQSLKTLSDPETSFPMVAVRTAGVGMESLVGVVTAGMGKKKKEEEEEEEEEEKEEEEKEAIHRLVSDLHLEILVSIARERFEANTARIRRFEGELFGRIEKGTGK